MKSKTQNKTRVLGRKRSYFTRSCVWLPDTEAARQERFLPIQEVWQVVKAGRQTEHWVVEAVQRSEHWVVEGVKTSLMLNLLHLSLTCNNLSYVTECKDHYSEH